MRFAGDVVNNPVLLKAIRSALIAPHAAPNLLPSLAVRRRVLSRPGTLPKLRHQFRLGKLHAVFAAARLGRLHDPCRLVAKAATVHVLVAMLAARTRAAIPLNFQIGVVEGKRPRIR